MVLSSDPLGSSNLLVGSLSPLSCSAKVRIADCLSFSAASISSCAVLSNELAILSSKVSGCSITMGLQKCPGNLGI